MSAEDVNHAYNADDHCLTTVERAMESMDICKCEGCGISVDQRYQPVDSRQSQNQYRSYPSSYGEPEVFSDLMSDLSLVAALDDNVNNSSGTNQQLWKLPSLPPPSSSLPPAALLLQSQSSQATIQSNSQPSILANRESTDPFLVNLEALAGSAQRGPESSTTLGPFPSDAKELEPYLNPALKWPWGPDVDVAMHTPKKNILSRSTRESERKKSEARPPPLRPPPLQAEVQEDVAVSEGSAQVADSKLNAEMQNVLKYAKEIEDMPRHRDQDRSEQTSHFRHWCQNYEIDHICFYHDYRNNHERFHRHPQQHHHHHHHSLEDAHQVPDRPTISSPRPRAFRKENYGQHRDAPQVWRKHRAKEPEKGDLKHGVEETGPMPKKVCAL